MFEEEKVCKGRALKKNFDVSEYLQVVNYKMVASHFKINVNVDKVASIHPDFSAIIRLCAYVEGVPNSLPTSECECGVVPVVHGDYLGLDEGRVRRTG